MTFEQGFTTVFFFIFTCIYQLSTIIIWTISSSPPGINSTSCRNKIFQIRIQIQKLAVEGIKNNRLYKKTSITQRITDSRNISIKINIAPLKRVAKDTK